MSLPDNDETTQLISVGHIEINPEQHTTPANPDDLPVLPTRNLVLFPGVSIPIALTRDNTLAMAREAARLRQPVAVICQKNPDDDAPASVSSLLRYGVVADVFKVIDLPDGTHTAIIRGRDRFRVIGRGKGEIIPGYLSVKAKLLTDEPYPDYEEFKAMMTQIMSIASSLRKKSGEQMPEMGDNSDPSPASLADRLNFIATTIPATPAEKIEMLQRAHLHRRAMELLRVLMAMQEKFKIMEGIMQKAQSKMADNQRSAFLHSQMEAIKEELYGEENADDDAAELIERADKAGMPENVRKVFDKQLAKLRRINPTTPDYSVEYTYLDNLVELPWQEDTSAASANINEASEVLEQQHYGLEKIKQRILEQIAVLLNNPASKAPIICLVGPPGVGKTSLGRSIAEAMHRPYQRVSLGGVHDESEIRGHRRTYIGAMPGRIIKAMKEAGATNPVLLLDEVDKLGRDHKGDPGSALLEVLDPEQNSTFHDNYLDIPYDLSKVLFIATANTLSTVDGPLLDRMEVIELSGYLPEEKLQIARRHLMSKVAKENGIAKSDEALSISDEGIMAIIDRYTSESGVRQLEKQLSALTRKMLLARLSGREFPSCIGPDDLKGLLGLPRHNREKYEGNEIPGVVTGLAWTSVGGEILLAEASLSPGKGDRLSITGNLGDVMKESAAIALQWVKSHAAKLGIEAEKFDTNNLHIHFPEGAIPKDGPSAGITIATAIASIFTGRKVRERIAMTGEITLRGRVLPVGGVKEKILAAKRAGITDIVLSAENRPDIEDIAQKYIDGLEFHYVETVDEVIDFSLIGESV